MPKRVHLKKLNEMANLVLCKEVDSNREWKVSKDVFDRFEWSGFPMLPQPMMDKIYIMFSGKDFSKLAEDEKKKLINELIEVATGHSVEKVFPNLA